MRWRGQDGDKVTREESRAQRLFLFKYDGESSSDDFQRCEDNIFHASQR